MLEEIPTGTNSLPKPTHREEFIGVVLIDGTVEIRHLVRKYTSTYLN